MCRSGSLLSVLENSLSTAFNFDSSDDGDVEPNSAAFYVILISGKSLLAIRLGKV